MRGRYWDDLEVGQVFESSGRTVTEGDVAAFAALSGDFNPLHMDAEVGRASPFGERIPHGPLGLLFAMGGTDRIGILEGVAVAFLDIRWQFVAPMRVGDTVRTVIRVDSLDDVGRDDRGRVTFHLQVCNQRDEVVQEGDHTFLVARRGEGG